MKLSFWDVWPSFLFKRLPEFPGRQLQTCDRKNTLLCWNSWMARWNNGAPHHTLNRELQVAHLTKWSTDHINYNFLVQNRLHFFPEVFLLAHPKFYCLTKGPLRLQANFTTPWEASHTMLSSRHSYQFCQSQLSAIGSAWKCHKGHPKVGHP